MYSEIVGTVLASLGGASLIVAGFANFLGKIWADRLAKTASAKFNIELEAVKSANSQEIERIKSRSLSDIEKLKVDNSIALEKFKRDSDVLFREQEQFGGISVEFYQNFFKKRVDVYLELLKIKNNHLSETHEEFVHELREGWGHVYYTTYKSLRQHILDNQLYISNELEQIFNDFRMAASEHIKEVDMAEGPFPPDEDEHTPYEESHIKTIYDNFAKTTSVHMEKMLDQINSDISKLRARIELDKA